MSRSSRTSQPARDAAQARAEKTALQQLDVLKQHFPKDSRWEHRGRTGLPAATITGYAISDERPAVLFERDDLPDVVWCSTEAVFRFRYFNAEHDPGTAP